ncbi:MAG: enoyl-CoA hydratase/isomerase family protein [bacterium]|jgi:enoyl-CoA hydratase|nr:enoyl-CoA hydratase/isomerase family protein [bacterium]
MTTENILCEVAAGVATVTINRPGKLNALDAQTIRELDACFAALATDPAARVVVVTGAGPKAFVAGADIGELATLAAAPAQELSRRGQALMDRIEHLGKPVIAAVNGFALGGGCELALACSFRWAADTAKLGLPETGLGLIPGYGGTQRLPRLVGRGRALEMILRGNMVTAAEALAIGLVDRVVPAAELGEAVAAVAREIAARSSLTLRCALEAVDGGLATDQAAGLRLEAGLFGLVAASDDGHEGCRAFLEKRPAVFTDR